MNTATANTTALQAVIQKYIRFDGVWHFTDRKNLESIQKHGLLSLAETQRRGIPIPVPGGNPLSHRLDCKNGLDGYVHLSFTDDHPMLFVAQNYESRILNPVWLKMDLSVLSEKGVLFTPGIANATNMPRLTHEQAAKRLDFEALYAPLDWKDPEVQKRRNAAKKSGILVPNCIPWEKVMECKDG